MGGVIVSVFFIRAFYLGKKIAAPVTAMGNVARKVAEGARDQRVPVEGPLEISDVAAQFNAMLDARERNEQALAASEQRMNRVLRGANDGWWDSDIDAGELF